MDKRQLVQRLFVAAIAVTAVAGCGGDDENAAQSPGPGNPSPPPPPPPPPASTLPAQLPTSFLWTSATDRAGATVLARSGSTVSAEGTSYTFSADSASRITVTGGAIIGTRSFIADQGAVLQLCREAGPRGTLAVLVGSGQATVDAAALAGKTFDLQNCGAASGDFVAQGSRAVVSGGTVNYIEAVNDDGVNEQIPLADLLAAGSNLFAADVGTLRWRAFRRPGGGIVIVETQSGRAGLAPGVDGGPNVFFLLERP